MEQFNLEEYLANSTKKVVTRDERNVKIYCTNLEGLFPLVAEIEGMEYSMTFNKDGKYDCDIISNYDLFFAEEE